MSDLLVGLGLAIVIEGLFWSLLPSKAREMIRSWLDGPIGRVRLMGFSGVIVGVAIVWLVRR
ncbi:MAG: DUF2065 domain-containing protein [Bauldia sp.]